MEEEINLELPVCDVVVFGQHEKVVFGQHDKMLTEFFARDKSEKFRLVCEKSCDNGVSKIIKNIGCL